MLDIQMHAPLPDQAEILLLEVLRTMNPISVTNRLHLRILVDNHDLQLTHM